jgi:glutathione S-transferase
MALRMFDLAAAEPERRVSPYCWRIRLALAHKGLDVETVPWRFTQKNVIAPSGQTLVPVLVDGDRWVSDSWTIAKYLEEKHPDSPSLFGGGPGEALTRYYSCAANGLVGAIMPFIAIDIFQHIAEEDKAYFRTSREKRLGPTLEVVISNGINAN